MLCEYFLTDAAAPLKPMLEQQLSWGSEEYGLFTSAYGWFNVFLIMLILGGIILDKMGVRFTGKMATILIPASHITKPLMKMDLSKFIVVNSGATCENTATGYPGLETSSITPGIPA